MKKTLIALSVALSSMLAIPAIAQNPQQPVPPCPPQCAPGNGPCALAPDSCPGPRMMNPFAGLNLTDKQQEKVNELNQKYAPLTPEQRRQQALDRRKDYLKDVKNILSKDQYTEFLENYYINCPAPGKQFKQGKGDCKKQGRNGGDCKKGNKDSKKGNK